MNKQSAEYNEGVSVIGERVEISLKDKCVYFIKYPNNYREDFAWLIYSPKDYKAIEFTLKNTERGLLWVLIAKQHDNKYINNFAKKLEEMLADNKRSYEEYNKECKEVDKFSKEISENTIMKMLWAKERFDELYEKVAKQNQLEQDANRAYKELSIIFKAEGLSISNEKSDD